MLTPCHLSDMDRACFLLQDHVYFRMGQLFAMSIVQVGIGFPFSVRQFSSTFAKEMRLVSP